VAKVDVETNRSYVTCVICRHKFTVSINKKGYIVVDNKYCRVRDSNGVINVKGMLELPPSLVLRSFPVND